MIDNIKIEFKAEDLMISKKIKRLFYITRKN